MAAEFYENFIKNVWNSKINFYYNSGAGLHRYYTLISCEGTKISLEFRHKKKVKTTELCGKRFFELIDVLGHPPKRKMNELRELIHRECIHQFKIRGVEWKEEYLTKNIY